MKRQFEEYSADNPFTLSLAHGISDEEADEPEKEEEEDQVEAYLGARSKRSQSNYPAPHPPRPSYSLPSTPRKAQKTATDMSPSRNRADSFGSSQQSTLQSEQQRPFSPTTFAGDLTYDDLHRYNTPPPNYDDLYSFNSPPASSSKPFFFSQSPEVSKTPTPSRHASSVTVRAASPIGLAPPPELPRTEALLSRALGPSSSPGKKSAPAVGDPCAETVRDALAFLDSRRVGLSKEDRSAFSGLLERRMKGIVRSRDVTRDILKKKDVDLKRKDGRICQLEGRICDLEAEISEMELRTQV